MKKNLYIIAIFLIIIVIIITGIFFYYSRINAPSSNTQQPTQQFDNFNNVKVNNPTTTQQDNQTYEAAINSGNVDKCSEMSDDKQQDLCVKLLAINSKNSQLCEKIADQNVIQDCYDRVNFEAAVQDKNLELCKVITDDNLNSSCVVNIISQNQYKEQDCENLKDDNQKDLCLSSVLYEKAITKKDILICQKIPGEDSNSECLHSIISEHNSLDYCQTLQKDLQETCFQIIAKKLAYEKKDKGFCDKIDDDISRNECKEYIDGILDPDKDGLTNSQEKIYNTDSDNPDTDGDGRADGEEIKNGFNPKGEGKMP